MPLFVTALICSPLDRPYSAWYVDVATETSWMASTLTLAAARLTPGSMAVAPSSMKLLSPPPPIREANVNPVDV